MVHSYFVIPAAFSLGSAGLATGESGSGPPIKTFGGDSFEFKSGCRVLIPAACCGVVHFIAESRLAVKQIALYKMIEIASSHTAISEIRR